MWSCGMKKRGNEERKSKGKKSIVTLINTNEISEKTILTERTTIARKNYE